MSSYVKKNREQCSACGLCVSVCANHAISMQVDEDGFRYPYIDKEKCTSCGACEKVCPFHASMLNNPNARKVRRSYAFKHRSDVQKVSSSGGFFTALSDYVLDNNGILYGAVFDEQYHVFHDRTENRSGRDKMRGSKYVQSDLSKVYQTIKQDVKSGRLVLFSGTPCQCAAVIRYFGGKKPENLIMMDLICHGVLSDEFFQQYLDGVCKKNPGTISKINFRDKDFGWQDVSITFDNGNCYHSADDYFYKAYATHAFQRSSCFHCPFATEKRWGDFTVGDYWGMQKYHPDFYDDLGVSLVLVNTEQGETILESCAGQFLPIQPQEYATVQPNLRQPTARGDRADKIQIYYKKHGYSKTMHRFFDVTLQRKINSQIAKILKKLHLR